MLRYEVLMLTVPEITADELRSIERQLEETVSKAGGSMISFERWGKYRLSYPIQKNEYGIYLLARFESPAGTDLPEQVRVLCAVRLHDVIMRSMVCCVTSENLAYQRPTSLEETPTRESSPFGNHDHRGDSSDNDDELSAGAAA